MSSERYQFASKLMKNVTRGATIDQKWDQAGPGGGKGYQQINQNVKISIKQKRQRKHKNEKTLFVYNMRRFLQNSEGSTAWRLPMFYEKKWYKCCIKQSTAKLNKNRKWANLHRKNVFSKTTMSQRHNRFRENRAAHGGESPTLNL